MQALVIDDCCTMRMLIRRLVQEAGLEVTEAGDGREGLLCLEAMAVPELIILDWKMPEMFGTEFVQIARAKPLYDRTFILMFSREAGSDEIRQAMKWGVDDYLTKPCSGPDIREKLKSVVLRITERQREEMTKEVQMTKEEV